MLPLQDSDPRGLSGGILPGLVRPILRTQLRDALLVGSPVQCVHHFLASSRKQRPSVERLLPSSRATSSRSNCRQPLARSARRHTSTNTLNVLSRQHYQRSMKTFSMQQRSLSIGTSIAASPNQFVHPSVVNQLPSLVLKTSVAGCSCRAYSTACT